jgi:AraC-like DNA-binding protein
MRSACASVSLVRSTTQPKLGPPRGLLHRATIGSAHGVVTGRIHPSSSLAGSIEHYWWVHWDVSEPRTSEVLTYPSVHIVFEGRAARIVGIVRQKFTRKLEGRGRVFGIKFLPGMFRDLIGVPVHHLTDREQPLANELGTRPAALARKLCALENDQERAELVEERLRAVLPPPSDAAVLARDLVERVRTDPALLSVERLAAISGLGVRALERLFREYVGVAPKWVVRRFRLQAAAEMLALGDTSVATVAAELGYYDQAHFTRDFKKVVGMTPLEYAHRATPSTRPAR